MQPWLAWNSLYRPGCLTLTIIFLPLLLKCWHYKQASLGQACLLVIEALDTMNIQCNIRQNSRLGVGAVLVSVVVNRVLLRSPSWSWLYYVVQAGLELVCFFSPNGYPFTLIPFKKLLFPSYFTFWFLLSWRNSAKLRESFCAVPGVWRTKANSPTGWSVILVLTTQSSPYYAYTSVLGRADVLNYSFSEFSWLLLIKFLENSIKTNWDFIKCSY